MAVFLLLIASFRVKIGLKNSYAPRVRLLGTFVRTRDLKACFDTIQTQIGQGNYTFAFLLSSTQVTDLRFS